MIIDCSGINIRSALQLMSQPENLPCIVCCHAGKDRTGIISALVLAVCGYDKDKIADDYALSEVRCFFGLRVVSWTCKFPVSQRREVSVKTSVLDERKVE